MNQHDKKFAKEVGQALAQNQREKTAEKYKGYEYRGYKIHWNNLKQCWRWYQRVGDRVDAIDTMTPEHDIDQSIALGHIKER